ncbi:unnamed protein product [Chironomus riparius]|uniref:Uncharacterized protein n=1 Tax=Chironomus riparius TaxID=315576 RepID=A0A9N9S856_9DIPT|nr:unnamed protein product [Chironomus riparius]
MEDHNFKMEVMTIFMWINGNLILACWNSAEPRRVYWRGYTNVKASEFQNSNVKTPEHWYSSVKAP